MSKIVILKCILYGLLMTIILYGVSAFLSYYFEVDIVFNFWGYLLVWDISTFINLIAFGGEGEEQNKNRKEDHG